MKKKKFKRNEATFAFHGVPHKIENNDKKAAFQKVRIPKKSQQNIENSEFGERLCAIVWNSKKTTNRLRKQQPTHWEKIWHLGDPNFTYCYEKIF